MKYLRLLMLVISVILLTGCKTKEAIQEIAVHDTTYINKVQADIVVKWDSIYVREYSKNDTVYINKDRWHTLYIDKIVMDSIYVQDAQYIRYTVQKKPPWWKEYLLWFSLIINLLLLVLIAIVYIYRRYYRRSY